MAPGARLPRDCFPQRELFAAVRNLPGAEFEKASRVCMTQEIVRGKNPRRFTACGKQISHAPRLEKRRLGFVRLRSFAE